MVKPSKVPRAKKPKPSKLKEPINNLPEEVKLKEVERPVTEHHEVNPESRIIDKTFDDWDKFFSISGKNGIRFSLLQF